MSGEGSDATAGSSGSAGQPSGSVKRSKLASLSDTTWQDLPLEMVELILVKAVALEGIGTSRAKNVWISNAQAVIQRLSTVCSQWNKILQSTFFRNELQRAFDALETYRLEIVFEFPLAVSYMNLRMLKDDVYVLRQPQTQVNNFVAYVYDRNNMAEVRDVIPLPAGMVPEDMATCNTSNCLYFLFSNEHNSSVVRLTKTHDHRYTFSNVIKKTKSQTSMIEVASNGDLYLIFQKRSEQRATISVYDPKGKLQRKTLLSAEVYEFFNKVIPKEDGNFITVSHDNQMKTRLIEYDITGTIVRQYQSSLFGCEAVSEADKDGHIVIAERVDRAELLDPNFNVIQEYRPSTAREDDGQLNACWNIHFDRDRNEVALVAANRTFTVLHFAEK